MIKLIFAANLAQIDEFRHRRAALSRNFNVSFHILCAPHAPRAQTRPRRARSPLFHERLFLALQKTVFHPPKGRLSHAKRLPFARRGASCRQVVDNQHVARMPQSFGAPHAGNGPSPGSQGRARL